jgi:hypothetical protein
VSGINVTRWALLTSPKAIFAPVMLAALTLQSCQAGAVSDAVTNACKNDYYAYCSEHAVGSEGLRQCMRAAGPALSLRCVHALIKSGDVSLAEVREIALRFKKAAKLIP